MSEHNIRETFPGGGNVSLGTAVVGGTSVGSRDAADGNPVAGPAVEPGQATAGAPAGQAVAPTGNGRLTEDEQNTIDVVKKTRNSVVYIINMQYVRDFFYSSDQPVPRGSGSGFVWDDAGHIVTNFYPTGAVLQRVADSQSTFPHLSQIAVLVAERVRPILGVGNLPVVARAVAPRVSPSTRTLGTLSRWDTRAARLEIASSPEGLVLRVKDLRFVADSDAIPIETRDGDEVLAVTGRDEYGQTITVRLTPPGARAVNYAFDVTPARLVTGLITERGIARAATAAIAALFPERVQ